MTEAEILQLPVRVLESGADLRLHLTSERMFTEIPPVESLDRLTKIELALSPRGNRRSGLAYCAGFSLGHAEVRTLRLGEVSRGYVVRLGKVPALPRLGYHLFVRFGRHWWATGYADFVMSQSDYDKLKGVLLSMPALSERLHVS